MDKLANIQLDVESRAERLRTLLPDMLELGRMRSDFALTHFVVGQHDTPGRQRAQALVELQSLYFSMGEVYDELKLAQLDLEGLQAKWVKTKRDRILIAGLERKIMAIGMNIFQRVKEIDCLLELLSKIPSYTAERLEKEEAAYWAVRLTRQAYLAPRDPGGNLDALVQYITEPGKLKPAVPVGPHEFLAGLGLDLRQVTDGLVKAGIMEPAAAELMLANQTALTQLLDRKARNQPGRHRHRKTTSPDLQGTS